MPGVFGKVRYSSLMHFLLAIPGRPIERSELGSRQRLLRTQRSVHGYTRGIS